MELQLQVLSQLPSEFTQLYLTPIFWSLPWGRREKHSLQLQMVLPQG